MAVERFQIQVSDEVLDDLKYRLDHVRWPDQLEDSEWERGTEKGYLQSLISYWRDHFDWRAQESELNHLSQFRCNVEGIDVHFVHERGKGPNPIPIILTHGWPAVSCVTRRSFRCLRILPVMVVIPRTLLM